MNIFQAVKKAFTKPETKPLPQYPGLKWDLIPPASILLFYGGNKLTELVGNRLYGHPYRPPAFHAAFYIGMPEPGLFLNVGKFRTLQEIVEEFRSTRRVDVIVLKGLTDAQRSRLCDRAIRDTSRPHVGINFPDYAFTDYLRFGFKIFHPSKKEFCSENVCDLFETEGVRISAHEPVDTAPWDLLEYAELHQDGFNLFTTWKGIQFQE